MDPAIAKNGSHHQWAWGEGAGVGGRMADGQEQNGKVASSQCKIAAAHSAQMDAMMAAVRADYDAKVAELKADLEATRGEKERMDTDCAYLKASSRTERLQWNKERKLLSRKIAEADARAREAADGIGSAEEFLALQKRLAAHESTIQTLHKTLDAKEAQQEKLKHDAVCGSAVQRDVDTLMVRAATLEQALLKEREARKTAEQEAEARAAEARGLERRLAAALEAAACAEQSAAASIEDVSKITAEVRDARAGQRHAELWLEKSLAEVDAVHAALAYERSVANGGRAHGTPLLQQQQQPQTPYLVDHAVQTPQPKPHGHPPSPADHAMQTPQPSLRQHPRPPSPSYDEDRYGGGGSGSGRTEVRQAAVGPTAQTPTPESPAAILASIGGVGVGVGVGVGEIDRHNAGAAAAAAAASSLPSFPVSPTSPTWGRADSDVRTPELDVTRPELFSTTRLRSRVGRRGRGMGLAGEDGDGENDDDDQLAATAVRGEGGRGGGILSPPTPTVLFGALAGDGESTRWGTAAAGRVARQHAGGEGDSRDAESAAAKAMMMRMARTPTTTPTKVGGSSSSGSGGDGAREDVAASLLSMLRLETSKRKQAEARTADLENAAAGAAAAAASTAASAAVASPRQQKEGRFNTSGDPAAGEERSGVGPCDWRAPGFGTDNGQQPSHGQASSAGIPMSTNPVQQQQQQPGSDCLARFAKADQERQEAKILGLVRDARKNMAKMSSSGRGGYFQLETSSGLSGEADPPSEVASLIRQFDGKLAQVADDNAQLRVFCTHLEGLLAAATPSAAAAAADGTGGKHGQGEAAGTGATARAKAPLSNGTAPNGAGWCGCNVSTGVSAGSSSKHKPKPPFALRRESLGKTRRGSALPGTFQEVC